MSGYIRSKPVLFRPYKYYNTAVVEVEAKTFSRKIYCRGLYISLTASSKVDFFHCPTAKKLRVERRAVLFKTGRIIIYNEGQKHRHIYLS